MKMYCVEHSKEDYTNSYYSTLDEARKIAEEEILYTEDEEEKIWISVGEMTEDGDYSSEETIEF